MRRFALLLGFLLVLAGCGTEEVFETVSDDMAIQVSAEPMEIYVDIPDDSVMPVMESNFGRVYICNDFDVAVQTLEAGDLDATVRTVSGFGREDLTIIETKTEEGKKYEFVWSSAGEMGQQVGRAAILDDGSYHYVVSAVIDAEKLEAYQEVWNGMFESFHIASY